MRRALLGCCATAMLSAALCAAVPSASIAPLTAASTTGSPLPRLHVAHPQGALAYIADPEGRRVLLRGVVTGGLVDYWSGTDPAAAAPGPPLPVDPSAYRDGRCPPSGVDVRQPALCRCDLDEMRALGFNIVRLAVSWSLLEPQPGVYDARYLDRIAQVVAWARSDRLYVILDLHQDGFSRFLPRPVPPLPGGAPIQREELSGAPAWAVQTLGLPSAVYLGQRELNPAVSAAFQRFWSNARVEGAQGEAPGPGLQDHYIGAIAALARRIGNDSTVVGYAPMNEPWPGFLPPPAFETLQLDPFYVRVIDAVAGRRDGLACPAGTPALPACGYPDLGVHDQGALWFLEPDHLREVADRALAPSTPTGSSPNVVYSIHAYTGVFTADALTGRPAGDVAGRIDASYRAAEAEAIAMHAALFVDEFGGAPEDDATLLADQLTEQERRLVGATLWTWKETCSPSGVTWGMWSGGGHCAADRGQPAAIATVRPNCLRPERARLMARVWPVAIGGTRIAYAYDPKTGAFRLRASAAPGSAPAVIVVPRGVTGRAAVHGSARLSVETAADGTRTLRITPLGGGYTVSISPLSPQLAGCVG